MLLTDMRHLVSTDIAEMKAFAESINLRYIHMYVTEENVPFFNVRPPSMMRLILKHAHSNPSRKYFDFTVHVITKKHMTDFKKNKKRDSMRVSLRLPKLFATDLPFEIFYDTFREVPKKNILITRDADTANMRYTEPMGLGSYVLGIDKRANVNGFIETIEGKIMRAEINEKWRGLLAQRLEPENHTFF